MSGVAREIKKKLLEKIRSKKISILKKKIYPMLPFGYPWISSKNVAHLVKPFA